jgi:hypothetical protein
MTGKRPQSGQVQRCLRRPYGKTSARNENYKWDHEDQKNKDRDNDKEIEIKMKARRGQRKRYKNRMGQGHE